MVFFKENGPDDWRISLRSKGDVDVNAIAKEFGGGGHKNASGCSAQGSRDALTELFDRKLTQAIALAQRTRECGSRTPDRSPASPAKSAGSRHAARPWTARSSSTSRRESRRTTSWPRPGACCVRSGSVMAARSIRWRPACSSCCVAAPRDCRASSWRRTRRTKRRIVFGVTTDTYDVTGAVTSRSSTAPAVEDVERALAALRGSYLQAPPAFSAKKVQGQRAYDLARRNEPHRAAAGAGHRVAPRGDRVRGAASDRRPHVLRRLLRSVIRSCARATGRARRMPRGTAAHAERRFSGRRRRQAGD